MADEQKTKLRLEIAHVLFIDIVGYSKLLIDEQSEALQELNQIVRTRKQRAKRKGPDNHHSSYRRWHGTGFIGSVEEPVECALEISQALRAQPSLPVRMGIHSGPVIMFWMQIRRENIAGAGINIAQRVMDCGDAGHILLSKHVAEDLEPLGHWHKYVHELGQTEVKHGANISVVNLYTSRSISGHRIEHPKTAALLGPAPRRSAL